MGWQTAICMKHAFIEPLIKEGLPLITKMRPDARDLKQREEEDPGSRMAKWTAQTWTDAVLKRGMKLSR